MSKLEENQFHGRLDMMQSNAGINSFKSSLKMPITLIESGPAGGVRGAAALGKLINCGNIISLDIGGTAAKCSLIYDGRISINTDYYIERNNKSAGYPVMVPVVDIVEIGNGGGSISWLDDNGKLNVGPQSAGAKPGPVAYGQGGNQLTTTDALLYLGRINPQKICGHERSAEMESVSIIAKE